MRPRQKSYGHSYFELTYAMVSAGWTYAPLQWTHPSGAVCSAEALDDLCREWPAFTGRILRILVEGMGFELAINADEEGFGASAILRAIPTGAR